MNPEIKKQWFDWASFNLIQRRKDGTQITVNSKALDIALNRILKICGLERTEIQ